MFIYLLYFILFVQAVLFILYFAGLWDIVIFVKVLFHILGHVLRSAIAFLLPTYRKSLKGELALVTGAASGIGRLTAIKLANQGCHLIIWDVNMDALRIVAEEIQAVGAEVHFYHCDLSKKEMVYDVAERVKQDVGRVTLLINNAGVVSGKKLLHCTDDQIMRTFQVNSLAHYWTIKSFLPDMLARNHGHIVSIASVAGLFGLVGCVDYCGSKFAAVGLMDALRREVYGMKKTGIKFTTICPSFINTGLFEGVKLKYPSFPGLGVLTPESVAESIVDAIRKNQVMMLTPLLTNVSLIAKTILPAKSTDMLMGFLGADTAMESFVGRQNHTR